ncbi:Cytochrome c [Cnuella takakiae]|uniref:Cytochrome c n=1 Tax=Cnuella takakiae TaxID=1302690 RepID=A0A1M4YB80_9BACT|nr:cytochrome c [Cnuella takakiae]OLY93097.1 cytochrome C class I [Cnuella takakiae]SHF02848.1 Cytochrome c [Cnuella takakiae]
MRSIFFVVLFSGLLSSAHAQTKKPATKAAQPAAAVMERGKTVYTSICLACHQVDGSGVPHLNPPLTPNEWVAGPKPRLVQLVLNGSQGKVEIDGDTWSNAMPAMSHLTDQQIADVLTYVRNSFGNKAAAVTPTEVKAQRGKK